MSDYELGKQDELERCADILMKEAKEVADSIGLSLEALEQWIDDGKPDDKIPSYKKGSTSTFLVAAALLLAKRKIEYKPLKGLEFDGLGDGPINKGHMRIGDIRTFDALGGWRKTVICELDGTWTILSDRGDYHIKVHGTNLEEISEQCADKEEEYNDLDRLKE